MPSTCSDWSSVVATLHGVAQFGGPACAHLVHGLAHQVGGVHDVETLPLDHLQRERSAHR